MSWGPKRLLELGSVGLSQRKAGELLGGGPRAFQKYESGKQAVSVPMNNLLRLLSNDPSRLHEIESSTSKPIKMDFRRFKKVTQEESAQWVMMFAIHPVDRASILKQIFRATSQKREIRSSVRTFAGIGGGHEQGHSGERQVAISARSIEMAQ